MQLNESDDIKHILKRWANFSKNKTKLQQGKPIVLPDMLWVARSGYGITNLLRLVSEYLFEERLMDFYGDVKFFEFELEYIPRDKHFDGFEHFKDALLDAAGFRNEFKGVIAVDITDWIDHVQEKYFINFLEYLSEHTDVWHIIFVVDNNEPKKIKSLEALLSVYFRIEKVMFKLPKPKQLGSYLENYLKSYGFEIKEDAKIILLDTIDELQKGKYFDGYKTINMICADLIYRVFSAENFDGYVISAEIASYYAKDSEYVERTKMNMEKRNSIGFFSRGDNDEEL